MATISESIDEHNSTLTGWNAESEVKQRQGENLLMMNKSSGSVNSELIDKNTPQTQKNKDEGALEFNGLDIDTRNAQTVQKKDKVDDGENDTIDKDDKLVPQISIGEFSALDDTSPLVGQNLNIVEKESALKGSPLKAMKDNTKRKANMQVQFQSMDDVMDTVEIKNGVKIAKL